jgi:hypothetical protein
MNLKYLEEILKEYFERKWAADFRGYDKPKVFLRIDAVQIGVLTVRWRVYYNKEMFPLVFKSLPSIEYLVRAAEFSFHNIVAKIKKKKLLRDRTEIWPKRARIKFKELSGKRLGKRKKASKTP